MYSQPRSLDYSYHLLPLHESGWDKNEAWGGSAGRGGGWSFPNNHSNTTQCAGTSLQKNLPLADNRLQNLFVVELCGVADRMFCLVLSQSVFFFQGSSCSCSSFRQVARSSEKIWSELQSTQGIISTYNLLRRGFLLRNPQRKVRFWRTFLWSGKRVMVGVS